MFQKLDKEMLNELGKKFGLEFDHQRDVSSMARMGRNKDSKKSSPLMVMF